MAERETLPASESSRANEAIAVEPYPSSSETVYLGRYLYRGRLGQGGMGVVVEAYDPELERRVAIKLVTAEHELARLRIAREAQAMARLSHTNVVTVYEVIRVGARSGIVMELVDGQNLATWRENSRLGWREILAGYIQAAQGLAALHREGLVHRDFKPSNALIDKNGVVRVTDFGLTQAIARSSDKGTSVGARETPGVFDMSLTRTGTVLGTPAYMAPEQHDATLVDARTDQWALACSLYEALYRQHPFGDLDGRSLRSDVLKGAIQHEPRQPPVPRAIRAGIRRALSVSPSCRFETMDDFIRAISPRARRAGRIAAGVSTAGVAALIAGAVIARGNARATCAGLDGPLGAIWNAAKARELRGRFAVSGVGYSAVSAVRIVAALDDFAARWIAARTEACQQARQGVQSQDLLDRRMRCLDGRLAQINAFVGEIMEGDPRVVRRASEAVDRLDPVSDCDEPRDSVPRPSGASVRQDIDHAEKLLASGWAFHTLEQFDRGAHLAREAVEAGERTGWTPLLARALVLRGKCESRQDDPRAAVATFERAATVAAQAKDDASMIEALSERFFVLGEKVGRHAEALADRKFIELALERAGQPVQPRALWLHNLAVMLLEQQKYDEALESSIESVAMWRKLVSPDHMYLLMALETEGNIQIFRGQFDRAEALLNEVLAAKTAARGADHPTVAHTLHNLGVLEARRGNFLESIERWQGVLAIQRANGDQDWSTLYNLGEARFEVGQWQASLEGFSAALAIAERQAPGATHPVGMAATGLGAALMALGKFDRAGALLERGIETLRDSGSAAVVDALGHASRLATMRGSLVAAKARLAEAMKVAVGELALLALADAEILRSEKGCQSARPAYEHALKVAREELSPSVEAEARAGFAECLIESRAPAQAVEALESQLNRLNSWHAEGAATARTRFALARALVASGGDHQRAWSLAQQAFEGFNGSKAGQVARWLSNQRR